MLLPSFPFWLIIYFLPLKTRDIIVHYLLKFYSNFWCYMTGIIPRKFHRKKIDFNSSYVIAANHQTYFDPVQMYTALPTYFKGVGKIEVNKAPLFGLLYRMAVIVVDRSSMRKSATTFRNMVRYLQDNWSIVIYPEATFPDEIQSEMYAFKKGAFALAQKEKKDILPMLFIDATKRMHPSSFFRFTPGYLTTVFLPPIPTEKFKEEIELRKFAQEYMQSCLNYCRKEGCEGAWEFALQNFFEDIETSNSSNEEKQILDWQIMHYRIYHNDGSYRDIYAENTSIEDYAKYIEFLNANFKIIWKIHDESEITYDSINFERIKEMWQNPNLARSTAQIHLNNIIIHDHFFDPSEIENDIDPGDIKTIDDHHLIIDYMKKISDIMNKNVILCPENTKESPLITVSNQQVTYYSFDKDI